MKKDYWQGKTVVVTGGLGFIGSHFTEELLKQGAHVICLYKTYNEQLIKELEQYDANFRYFQINLTETEELAAIFKYAARKIDVIIHCAALDGNAEFKMKHAAQILDSNLRSTSNVLNCARDNEIKDVCLFSSAEIYPNGLEYELTEEDDYRKHLWFSENGYILSKIMCEIMAQTYRKQYGMNVQICRPTNVYGPRDKFNRESQRVIPSMIAKIKESENIQIWGDGTQTRQFIHVKDLVNAVLAMIADKKVGIMNIANKDAISILELANILIKMSNGKSKIVLKKDMPVGPRSRVLSCKLMYGLIDFQPMTIETGLKDLISTYT